MEAAAQRLLCAPVYAEQPQLKEDTLLSLQTKKTKKKKKSGRYTAHLNLVAGMAKISLLSLIWDGQTFATSCGFTWSKKILSNFPAFL